MLVAAVLIGTGYDLWQNIEANLHAQVIFLSLACYVIAFGLLAVGFTIPEAVPSWVGVGALAFAFLAYACAYIKFRVAYYGTDALLFNAYSAGLLAHGIDPYTRSMEAAYRLFNAPNTLVTPTSHGGGVYLLSYPALSFLLYLPFIALHVHNLLWVSVLAHVCTIVLLAAFAPPRFRIFAPLVLFVSPSFFDYTVGGVTDILWLPLLLIVARTWERYPTTAAVCLGFACAIKQTPWLVVPFACITWARSAIDERSIYRFATPFCALVAAFAIPNLPFAIWHPSAWLRGVGEPLAGELVPFGSGLIQFATSNLLEWQSGAYQRLSLGVFALLVAVYVWRGRQLAFLPFLAPPVVLFFAPRSLQNYFMYWPIVLGAFIFRIAPLTAPVATRRVRFARVSVATVAVVLVVATAIGIARASHQSVSLSLGNARIDANTQQIDRLRVTVRNDGPAKALRFAVLSQGQGSGLKFWNRGQAVPVPGQTTTAFWISPGSASDQVPVDDRVSLQVVAFDADSGNEAYSNARVYTSKARGLSNGALTAWSSTSPHTPSGWSIDTRDFTSGVVRRESVDGRSALRFDLAKPSDGAWHVASISQRIPADVQSFRVRIRPDESYVGDIYPRAIFGVEIIDALGRHLDYAIDASITVAKTYRRDESFTYVIVPGRLRAWNDVLVDLRPYRDSLLLTPGSILNVSIVAAVHSSYGHEISGTFGGIFDMVRGATAGTEVR